MQAVATLLSGLIVLATIYSRMRFFNPRNNGMALKITMFIYFATVVGFLVFDLGGALQVRQVHVDNLASTAAFLSQGGGESIGPMSYQLAAFMLVGLYLFFLPTLKRWGRDNRRRWLIGAAVVGLVLLFPLAWVLNGLLYVTTAILLAVHDYFLIWLLSLIAMFFLFAVVNVLLAEIMLGVNIGLVLHAWLLGQGIETFSFLNLLLLTFDDTRAISIAIVAATSASAAVSFLSNFNAQRLEEGLSPMAYLSKLVRWRW
ncbi:MAG: hypothetical protein AAGF71_15160 [Pseudomonadota bacterium]